MEHSTLKELVESILRCPPSFGWSTQGLGMLRFRLGEFARLQVWHPDLRIAGVSDIHTHPWSFTSTIVVGDIQDNLYKEVGAKDYFSEPYIKQGIRCGVGSGTVGELLGGSEKVLLRSDYTSLYDEGRTYFHSDTDIHSTSAAVGTVTLLEREPNGSCQAAIYWPEHEKWVSAQPRDVVPSEVQHIIQSALRRF